jgi:phage shock protein A
VFGFLKRKKKPPERTDPLAVYDGFIESLERQGAEVRKSAATLLALRGDLGRDVQKYLARATDLTARIALAEEKGDSRATKTLRRDLEEAENLREQSEKALIDANDDAQLLLEAAGDTARRVAELKSERQSARARLATGQVVSTALRQQVEQFDRVLALDAARDEVERARALADVYRDDADKKRLPDSS